MPEEDDKDDEYRPFRDRSRGDSSESMLTEQSDGPAVSVTPEPMIVPNKGTLEVTITKIREYKPKMYWIELNSYLFEIVEPKPTASKDSWTQVYGSFNWKDDREIKIRIKLRDKEKSDPNYIPNRYITPEGTLTIGISKKDRDWYYMFAKSGIIHNMGSYYRSSEQESFGLEVEKENEDIRERRQKFEEKKPLMEELLKERERKAREKIEELEQKRKEEEDKKKALEKGKAPEKKSEKAKEKTVKNLSKAESKVEPKPKPKAESQYQNLDAQLPPELKNPTTVKTSGDQKKQKAMDKKKKGNIKKNKKNPCCSIL